MTAGTILPYLAARDSRLLRQRLDGDADDDDVDEDEEISRIRQMVRSWKAEAIRMGKPLRLPPMPFMLRNIWTMGLLLFGILMTCTVFVRTVWQVRSNTIVTSLGTERKQASVLIGFVGLSWAIACWVPFAIIMEVCFGLRIYGTYPSSTMSSSLKKSMQQQGNQPLRVAYRLVDQSTHVLRTYWSNFLLHS